MKNLVIGVDIGGTNTKYGIADREGIVYFHGRIGTFGHDNLDAFFDALIKDIKDGIDNLNFDFQIKGVGVGAPNGNYYTGTIENAPNLPWKFQIPITEILSERLGVQAILTNDANAAAIGEMVYGGAKGMKDFIVITLGTGLGSGFVANGHVIYGHDGYAGELGHITVKENGRQCGCGKRGCMETYVSATGIRRTVYKLLADHIDKSELQNVSFNELSTIMITEAALRGDAIALEAFDYTGKILGFNLANTVAHTSPEAIFIFGGLAKAEKLIFDPAKKYMEENLLSFYKNKVKILPSELPDESAPILGASSLIWKHLEDNN